LTHASHADDALPLLQKAISISNHALGANNPVAETARAALGNALVSLHRYTEAEPLLRQAQPVVNQTYGENAVISAEIRAALASLGGKTQL
jgi:hypothetical protein